MKQITFKQDVYCKTLCKKTYKNGDKEQMKKLDFLKNGIALNYQNYWYALHGTIHNLPMASALLIQGSNLTFELNSQMAI